MAPLVTRLFFLCIVSISFASRVSGQLVCDPAPGEDFDIDNVRSSPSDSVHLLVTDDAEEAGSTALCHVACIMDTSNGGMNATMPEGGSENMTDTPLPMEPLDLGMMRYNCAQVKKYLDCRTGCIAQSKGLANCAATCSGRCDSLCGSSLGCFGFDGNRCGVGCVRDDCEEGCQQFTEFSNSTLPKPTDPPQLTRLNIQELYDVSIPSDLVLEGKPSLVYRIETQPGEYVYQWMVVIMYDIPRVVVTEFLLDLSAFVGRSINVSFAYATQAGLSAYSDPTEMRLFNEVVPVSPSDTVHRIVTDSQDHCENAALCHITCLPGPPDMTNNSGNSSEMENEMGNECSNGTGLDSDDICAPLLSCAQVKKYLDCRTGCIAQSMGQADCATTCSGRCTAICGSSLGCFGFDGNRCGVGCETEDCSAGCQKGSQLTSDRLMAPMTPPQLERMPQNIYDVIIPSDSEIKMFTTSSPVFRIATETGEVYYQWMVDILYDFPDVSIVENQLDLSAYTGQRLNISYAFATDVGISEYSPVTTVQIQGVEGVSHYVITRNPASGRCGGTVTETVNASTSNVLLMSNSPTRLPLPCTQTVQIQTVLIDGSMQEVTRTIRLAVVSRDDSIPAVKSLSCPIEFDRERQLYRVDFEFLVPFSPAALSHIDRLVIRVDVLKRLRDSANPFSIIQVGIVTDTILASVGQTLYNYTTYLELFREADVFYWISVEVAWMSPSGPGRSDSCSTTDAIAPPFPVQSITITDVRTFTVSQLDTQRVEASVSIEWEEPELLIERVPIAFYEVYFGTVPLQPTEDGRNIDTFSGTQLNGSVVRLFDNVPISDVTLTTFVQIRSYQFPNIPSSWSMAEEVVLLLSQVPDTGVFVNDTLTGDPLMTVPIFNDPNVMPGDSVPSLCYEIHGESNAYFNLITDNCTSVNAYFQTASTPSPNIDLNVVTRIGVKAVGETGMCWDIQVNLDGMCNATVNGGQVPDNTFDGISVKSYPSSRRVRISVPNCADTKLVMWVFCREGQVEDPVTWEYFGISFIRYVVMRGLNLDEKSHGLIGQFWNVPVTVEPYSGVLNGVQRNDDYKITVDHPDSDERSFIGLRADVTWEFEKRVCYYVGNRQGGKLAGVIKPNDSVIEGEYSDYKVESLFSTDFAYTHFDADRC